MGLFRLNEQQPHGRSNYTTNDVESYLRGDSGESKNIVELKAELDIPEKVT